MWGTNYTPPATVPVTSNVTAVASASNGAAELANMTPDAFYSRMATVMGGNPPYSVDKPVIDQIARIGTVPGKPFDWNSLNATTQNAITEGFQGGTSQCSGCSLARRRCKRLERLV